MRDFSRVMRGVDKDRAISTKFEALPLLDSLCRLLRDTNFLYVVGEKLYVLGFGKEIFKNGAFEFTIPSPLIRDLFEGSGGSLIPESKKECWDRQFSRRDTESWRNQI